MVRAGELRALRAAVYAPAHLVTGLSASEAGRELLAVAAALASTGAYAAGSHRSAAVVHGLSLVGRRSAGQVELTRCTGSPGSRSRRPGILLHVAQLPADQVTLVRGVRFTGVPRTVVDLARVLPFAEGVALADAALREVHATRKGIEAVLTSCRGWPGIERARRVVTFADSRAESVLESLSRVAFHEAGLPPPDLQVWMGDDGEIIARVDFLWKQHRTIAEADGAMKYANPQQARAQLDRDARLRAAGYEVVHFTWAEITRVPGQVAAAITAAFQRTAAWRQAAARQD